METLTYFQFKYVSSEMELLKFSFHPSLFVYFENLQSVVYAMKDENTVSSMFHGCRWRAGNTRIYFRVSRCQSPACVCVGLLQ